MANKNENKKPLDISTTYVPQFVGEPGNFKFKSPIGQVFENATYLTAEPFKEGFAKVTKLGTKETDGGSFYLDLAGVESKEKTKAGEQLYSFLKGEISADEIKFCNFGNPDVVGFVKSAAMFRSKQESENINDKKEPLKLRDSLMLLASACEAADKLKADEISRQKRLTKISANLLEN